MKPGFMGVTLVLVGVCMKLAADVAGHMQFVSMIGLGLVIAGAIIQRRAWRSSVASRSGLPRRMPPRPDVGLDP
jgi:hypothetical protein